MNNKCTRVSLVLFLLVLVLGAFDAWCGRHSYLEGDTISYMDMASGIAMGHFREAINELWSPLYPVVVAAFIWPFEPDVFREFSAVRVADFLIFAFTLGSFSLLLQRLLDQYYRWFPLTERSAPLLSRTQFTFAGYAAFLWAVLDLNQPSRVNPDLGVMGIVFLSLAILLSLLDGNVSWAQFVLLGVTLGLGYWLKAILFPLALLVLLIAGLSPRLSHMRFRVGLSFLVFAAIALPLVFAVSVKADRLTISETSRLNYIWHVNRVPHWLHWQGGPAGNGVPIHPTRQIFTNPDAFEFGTPIVATYAPWYDPYYWYQGVKVRIDPRQQLHSIGKDLYELGRLLYHEDMFWACFAVFLVLFWRYWDAQFFRESMRRFAPLWVFAFGSIGLYLMVHVELRYLAAFFAILILLGLALFRKDPATPNRSIGALVASALFIAALFSFVPRLYSAGRWMIQNQEDVRRDDRWSIANEFARIGVPAGTPVAAIGETWISDWARLARLRVVCEIARENHEQIMKDTAIFWAAPIERQQQVLQAFKRAGARIVIANFVPPGANTAAWIHIPGSTYYYRFLDWPPQPALAPPS